MTIQIRPYSEADVPSILDIINDNILHSTSLYDYEPRSLANQSDLLKDKIAKNFPVIIAEIDGKIAGFGMYGEFRFRDAYRFTVEHSVYVSKDFKGKGVGGKLLQSLIDIARKQGLHTMIGVIDAENTESILFHEKYGFKNVGIIKESGFKFNRWLDSVFMQLILEENT
ncbi:MAG TPA: N-acetyltransferase family protein [Flavobacterium sp.]|uniref:GNAT family N-acetyltransferase n=1 Tax=unclassified Flavobacterium TaxID=196869 RepID=UPI000E7EA670|nr:MULTISPECIES: GNAT family N-acetyltransferase [unclassified Flavobacterium]HBI00558.1 N-acetyltransferase [Flavobacterium sp.]HRE78165.1 N-acetyltransferase family protein [Flavobacterium sp.]